MLSEDMSDFIKEFKARRIHLGYTQDDVGKEMSVLKGPTYSQSFISRFVFFKTFYFRLEVYKRVDCLLVSQSVPL